MAVVTVARQLGSGGDWIAQQVAEKLGYQYIDHYLVEELARLTNTTVADVEEYDEKGEGRIQYFLKRMFVPELSVGGIPVSAFYMPEIGMEFAYLVERDAQQEAHYLDRGTYQLLITTLVQDFGTRGKAVIVGRASQAILASYLEAVHVKIVAPFAVRVERIMQKRALDQDSAGKLVAQHDRWRQQYLRNYYRADWDDPFLYDMTINTDRMDEEEAVALVVQGVRNAEDQSSKTRKEVLLHA